MTYNKIQNNNRRSHEDKVKDLSYVAMSNDLWEVRDKEGGFNRDVINIMA